MSITGIILTYNEHKHIERAILSLKTVCSRICIVDSFSTDNTIEIARSLGADIYQNAWKNNHSIQMNWALENCNITTDWVFRLDADEYLEPELSAELNQTILHLSPEITGLVTKRKNYFLDKWIRFGGYYPVKLIRIFRMGVGKSEMRFMDEHVSLRHGKTQELKYDLVDKNLNNLSWWSEKHIKYAQREAIDFVLKSLNSQSMEEKNLTFQAKMKRFLKERLYYSIPLGIRPFLYFFYRYFVLLGFLDGFRGFGFHVLQGFWYRFLVDINIYEVKRNCGKDTQEIKQFVLQEWKIEIE
ncbi:MAG: glycosyltransferase family 2 protein [Leadbetterella sp.]